MRDLKMLIDLYRYENIWNFGSIEVYGEYEEEFMEREDNTIVWKTRKIYRLIEETGNSYEFTSIINVANGYVYTYYCNCKNHCKGDACNVVYFRSKILASRINKTDGRYKFMYIVGNEEECEKIDGSGRKEYQIELLKKLAKEVIN